MKSYEFAIKRASFFAILSLVLAGLLLSVFFMYRDMGTADVFAQDGYILTDAVYSNADGVFVHGYEFRKGARYDARYPGSIEFTGADGNRVYAGLDGFVHYGDGSIGVLSNAVLLSLDDFGPGAAVRYNITPATPVKREGESYTVRRLSGEAPLDSFIVRLETGKLLIAAPSIELYVTGGEPREYGEYLEVNYIDGSITSIAHDSGAMLPAAAECHVMVNGTRIDLAAGMVTRPDTDEAVYIKDMASGARDNIDLVANISVSGLAIPQVKRPVPVPEAGKDGNDANGGGAADLPAADIPAVRLDDSGEFRAYPAGGVQTVLTAGDNGGALREHGELKLVECLTGRVIYKDGGLELSSGKIDVNITADDIKRYSLDTYGTVDGKLIEGVEYALIVGSYSGELYSKRFRPNIAGIDVYLRSAGPDWLTFAVQMSGNRAVEQLSLKLLDGAAAPEANDRAPVQVGGLESGGLTVVTFGAEDGTGVPLKPDHRYLVQVADFKLDGGADSAALYGAPVVEAWTLKETPAIEGMYIRADGGLTFQAINIYYLDGGGQPDWTRYADMEGYRYEIYDGSVDDDSVDTADPIMICESDTLAPVSVQLDGTLLRPDSLYRARVVGLFDDSSKLAEVEMTRNDSAYPYLRVSDAFGVTEDGMSEPPSGGRTGEPSAPYAEAERPGAVPGPAGGIYAATVTPGLEGGTNYKLTFRVAFQDRGEYKVRLFRSDGVPVQTSFDSETYSEKTPVRDFIFDDATVPGGLLPLTGYELRVYGGASDLAEADHIFKAAGSTTDGAVISEGAISAGTDAEGYLSLKLVGGVRLTDVTGVRYTVTTERGETAAAGLLEIEDFKYIDEDTYMYTLPVSVTGDHIVTVRFYAGGGAYCDIGGNRSVVYGAK